jgi:hypothetical protein
MKGFIEKDGSCAVENAAKPEDDHGADGEIGNVIDAQVHGRSSWV